MTCEQCIYWHKLEYLKDHGECQVDVPFFIDRQEVDVITHKLQGSGCVCFQEEQEVFDTSGV